MDETHNMFCKDDLVNPMSSMGLQVSCILVVSHFFNVLFRTVGQPGPIAQILAGLILGPLSHIPYMKRKFFPASSINYYEVVSFFCRIHFMFLFGLEMNIHYTLRHLRLVTLVACGGAIMGGIFGLSGSFYLYHKLNIHAPIYYFCMVMMLMVSYTSSPMVIRLSAELRLATSDVGRIAVSSALITEMGCLLFFNVMVTWNKQNQISYGIYCTITTTIVILINKHLAVWLNSRDRNQKYLNAPESLLILFLLLTSSMIIEILGYNSIISCFIIGLLFPKEGKTARTLIHKLGYSIYNFVLPVYFGYLGLQCDLINVFRSLDRTTNVAILILLSIGSKLGGTLLACRYLHISTNEGIFIGFMLNTRGYADLLFFGAAAKQVISVDTESYNVLLVSIVFNTIISGIVVASLSKGDDKMFSNNHTAIEPQQMENELRILACVYDPRQVSTILSTILAIHGSKTSPSITYFMHLIELVKKIKSNLLFHEKENDELSDEEDSFGGNDVVDINNALDSFTAETKILVYQKRAVSSFSSLYEDVCNEAENLRVSIILIPFHKHQRIDGKLESGKDGIRTTNQKILRHAPCSVGVIIERGLTMSFGFSELIQSDNMQNVATLFIGGPDDREAIAWSLRISKCPCVNMTIIRFLLSSSPSENEQIVERSVQYEEKEILMSLSGEETVNDEIDNNFMVDFYNRYVASGNIGYVENFVKDGKQTLECLKQIGDIYSLFIVGKGSRRNSSITIGMSDWEECPELGTVGDVLASSDFDIHGSVLVIQQHRNVKKGLIHS
ncbi:cation/H(+) antiporter 2-like [Trifolium pratense]|uniref:cation/H(+) antiporter 2-like n=1 Tax=Trifolium pratense TaxID=57577 RepID=UPI001E693D90|nr:cation/H(+) antiporter 2-like [Trifolium pratense]